MDGGINPVSPGAAREKGNLEMSVAGKRIRFTLAVSLLAGLAGGMVAFTGCGTQEPASDVQTLPQPHNLLPNASFELPFGEEPRQPTNWGNILNPLTLQLAATGQQPQGWPPRRMSMEAVEGDHVARIALDPVEGGGLGHLTSPLISIQGGQVYTLSAYARSDVPSASLRLAFWTRPLDWRKPETEDTGHYLSYLGPDAQSEPLPLDDRWQRYQVTFVAEHLVSQAVVDLEVSGSQEGLAWVDAVQLELGPRATDFQTRYPVEAVLSGRRRPPMLHLVDEPLQLYLSTYNSSDASRSDGLKLSIETLEGESTFTSDSTEPVEPGHGEQQLSYDLQRVGEFRARIDSARGHPIGLEEYWFVVHPVMDRDLQGVTYSRRGRLHQLPAQRVWIPWGDTEDFFADPQANLTVTHQGAIYAGLKGSAVAVTRDGGRSWSLIEGTKTLLSVLRDGTFLNATYEAGHLVVHASQDEGKSWTTLGEIEVGSPQPGPITQLQDGSLVWPIGQPRKGFPFTVHAYRSEDGGRSWSQGYPICAGGEPAIIQRQSGMLLAVARHNPSRARGEWEKYLVNEPAWRLWQRATSYYDHHRNRLTSYEKNLLMADSDDGGITWKNTRAVTHLLDEMHGSAVELPDGRVVLMYVHRLPAQHGGERAKVSTDGGYTWEEELYYLNTVDSPHWEEVLTALENADGGVFTFGESMQRSFPAVGQNYKGLWHINDHLSKPGYSASCVLPPELADGEPGMILTIVGERKGQDRPARMQVIRWRPVSQ